jgi:hypothetical protein
MAEMSKKFRAVGGKVYVEGTKGTDRFYVKIFIRAISPPGDSTRNLAP